MTTPSCESVRMILPNVCAAGRLISRVSCVFEATPEEMTKLLSLEVGYASDLELVVPSTLMK